MGANRVVRPKRKSARPSSSWDEAPIGAGSRPAFAFRYTTQLKGSRKSRSPRTRLARHDGHPGGVY
ncbi:hypothetical protein COLSTE_01819 [Collinsella stercoris DSM 13279]|uniref:Uncharacterized protein n=1 Tax=Collinsella stercoris DSM 13279 TaxID=445975 RepID=B6GCJ6_9ACTN|nr:hypothetical protein COLSTE_01819 [Collinsella stercoris DSM 13279]